MKNGKIWGTTELVYAQRDMEIHRIDIASGGYCSKHHHASKHNIFYVERGKLKIEIWEGDTVDTTILSHGETIDVPPMKKHRFEAIENTVAYEIYYVDISGDDIIRDTVGGIHGTTR